MKGLDFKLPLNFFRNSMAKIVDLFEILITSQSSRSAISKMKEVIVTYFNECDSLLTRFGFEEILFRIVEKYKQGKSAKTKPQPKLISDQSKISFNNPTRSTGLPPPFEDSRIREDSSTTQSNLFKPDFIDFHVRNTQRVLKFNNTSGMGLSQTVGASHPFQYPPKSPSKAGKNVHKMFGLERMRMRMRDENKENLTSEANQMNDTNLSSFTGDTNNHVFQFDFN